MLIKRFEESDAVDVLETFLVSWISAYHHKLPTHAFEERVAHITLDYVKHFAGKKRFCFVAREHRKVTGFIYCKTGALHGTIEQFLVLPEKKRAGFGAELLEKALHEFRQRHAAKVRAFILCGEPETLAFYRAQGFQVVKRVFSQAHGGTTDIYVEKNLLGC